MLMSLLLEHDLTNTFLCMSHEANLNGSQEWHDCTMWSDLNHFHGVTLPCGTRSMDLYDQLVDVTFPVQTYMEWYMLS